MSVVRLMMASVLVSIGLVGVFPAPAYACSCALGGMDEYVAWSDVVFTGTLADSERVSAPGDGVPGMVILVGLAGVVVAAGLLLARARRAH